MPIPTEPYLELYQRLLVHRRDVFARQLSDGSYDACPPGVYRDGP
jgi:hypothetical protein